MGIAHMACRRASGPAMSSSPGGAHVRGSPARCTSCLNTSRPSGRRSRTGCVRVGVRELRWVGIGVKWKRRNDLQWKYTGKQYAQQVRSSSMLSKYAQEVYGMFSKYAVSRLAVSKYAV